MAWTVDKSSIGSADAGSGGSTTAAFTTNQVVAANAWIYVVVINWAATGGGRNVDSVAGGGLTWEVVGNASQLSGSDTYVALARAWAPAGLASSTTITATYAGSATNRAIGGASFVGGDATSSTEETDSNTGTLAAHTVVIDNVATTALLIQAAHLHSNSANTPAANTTELLDFGQAGGERALLQYRLPGDAGPNSLSGTWDATGRWATVGASFLLLGTTAIPFAPSSGISSATLPVTVPGISTMPFAASAGLSSATLAVHAQTGGTVPLNAATAAATATLAVTSPAPPFPGVNVREKPPLGLSIDLVTPAGRHYRWSGAESNPENVFSGLRFSSTMPGGYESCDCELPRKPGTGYDDLESLSTLNIYGRGVDKAGEYRLERTPRTSGDKLAVSPSAVGWQAALDDDKSVVALYRDIDLSHWTGPSASRKAALFALPAIPVDASVTMDGKDPTVSIEWQDQPAVRWIGEALYDGKAGNEVASIYYDIVADGTATLIYFYVGDDDHNATDRSSNLTGGGTGVYVPSTPRRFAFFQSEHGAEAAESLVARLRRPAVYGNHGLTKRGTEPNAGFYASDVVAHAVGAFAPILNFTEGAGGTIRPSIFVLPHFAYLEPTTCSEIVKGATRYGLQGWGVWDDRTFWWGAEGKTWRARIGPAQLEETGSSVERLWNSVMVSYTDVDGSTRTVGPTGSGADTEDATLVDDDPSNPANQLGIVKRELLSMGTTTPAGAIEVGARFLEQSVLLDRSGRATLVGHVEDDCGVLHPFWKVRAGDTIVFMDAADTSERRIVRAEHSYDTRSCSVDLDAPPEGLAALLERLGVVLVSLGIS